MRARKLFASVSAVAALTVALAAAPAAAQTPRYWVKATADVDGMPSPPAQVVGPLVGETEAVAQVDAGPMEWKNYTKTVYGAAHTAAATRMAVLDVEVAGMGDPLSSTQFPTYGPGGWAEGRFADSVVVTSGLPVGTPVTLTFRVAASGGVTGSGHHTTSQTCSMTVNGVSGTSARSFKSWIPGSTEVASPTFTYNTKVGNRLTLGGYLRLQASAPWMIAGFPGRGGEVAATGHCELVLESASEPVWLVADSGHDYGTPAF